jgi:hypothetical protein
MVFWKLPSKIKKFRKLIMNTIEELKEVIEGCYGITDLKSYGDYKKKVGERGITQQEIELLSPDNINSSSFWEYIEKNPEIARDSIAFGMTKEKSKEEVNNQNFALACSMNALSYIILYRDCVCMPILDIGAGYGMLRDFIKKHTKLTYCGVDVYPKCEDVYPVGKDGSTLPPNVASSLFGLIVAINTFQHLSVKQRRHYYEQIDKILHPDFGIFTMTINAEIPNSNIRGFKCNNNGKTYTCHYGQYVEIQPIQEIDQDLCNYFNIISISQRVSDNSFTFHCNKKKIDVPSKI